MHLGTRQECVGSSPRVSGVCQDSAREFAKRRPSDDAIGSRRKFAKRFAEGIRKLAGKAKGDYRKEDRRTCRKITGVCGSKPPVSSGWTARTTKSGWHATAFDGSDNAIGSRRKFAKRFAEGIRKLAGNAKGDYRKEDQRTCRKITGVWGRFDLHPKKISSGCRCASRRRTRKWT
ncbi:hypothetical protein B296_00002160 [Ensete ventricosum]|uniref:Uncharacterized protein n=1 Tax=Ensete ventricosum TaxID=4639 RepID=A0A426Z367_ENSVE|nr:hypothetical protein B296_00002160 [Ensete ventricosum]